MATRTFAELTKTLADRANMAKAAAAKAAAGDTPAEKDPAEKGVVAIPKDPNASNDVQKLPPKTENAEVTPVITIAPAKTVGSEAKVANSLAEKANGVLAGIRNLRKSATAAEITPTLVCDKGSDNADTNPAPSTSDAPAKKQNPDSATKDAAPEVSDTKDPRSEKAPAPKFDSKGDLPSESKNENETGMSAEEKAASDFDPSFHFKLASLILATEDGRAYAQSVIEAAHGAAEAESIIKAASFMEQQANELQALEDQGAFAAEEMWAAASPEEREQIVKLANAHEIAKSTLATEQEKMAYDAGAAAGAEMADAGALGDMAGAEGAAPMGDEGGGEITDEDIMAVLSKLVQSGEIQPEEAEAILQALSQGGAEGAEGATPSGEPDGDEALPPEPTEPEGKAAYAVVKSASVATKAIMASLAAAKK